MENIYKSSLKSKGKPLFIPFTVLGDPDYHKSLEVIKVMIENGADALELGFPFSDPPADGPVIQAAHKRALENGMTTRRCFELIAEVRKFSQIPIGLLIYYNLVLQYGTDAFYAECAKSGVNSVLIADLPLEHVAEISEPAEKHKIGQVYLVSELTTKDRLEKILERVNAYIYLVSYLGVTGKDQKLFGKNIAEMVKSIRAASDIPVFVGFGIGSAEQASVAIQSGVDGFLVGSKLVQEIPNLEKIKFLTHQFYEATR